MAGCEKVFSDTASGAKRGREGLEKAIGILTKGDVLVIWKLDRIGRSLMHLLETAERIKAKGAAFTSLTEGIDTTTACGEMVFNLMGAMAQFERSLIRERTKAGLAAARERGHVGGRKRVTEQAAVWAEAERFKGDIREVCRELKISQATYYRAMKGVRK